MISNSTLLLQNVADCWRLDRKALQGPTVVLGPPPPQTNGTVISALGRILPPVVFSLQSGNCVSKLSNAIFLILSSCYCNK